MANDLEIIKHLEKKTGEKLKKWDKSKIFGATNGFVMAANQNVTGLNLYFCMLLDISFLKDLEHLTHLYLIFNQITDLSPLKELKHLIQLDLSHNQISQLPREILQLNMEIKWGSFVDGIFLTDNPLETPPVEIVKQGDEAVRNYFKELERASIRLLESKLLIVGNGEVRKTTLMRKLKDNNFQVEVGKESTTHQFFLTKRSLYLLAWEARKEEESRSFDYWLNIIKLLSADSPVIVVMNKSDVRIKHIDEALFKEKFKNIAAFLQVSCLTGEGIEKLSRQIRFCLNEMPHLHDKLPKVWKQIRDHLKKEEKNYISLKEYFAICRQYGMNEERAEFLSDYLHDLGVILHYRGDQLLENTVILKPGWATAAVYKLVDTREIQENKGRFKTRDVRKYWDPDRFPREIHPQLIRLMEKFELCFPIIGSEFHIVPELLPAKRPTLEMNKYKIRGNLHFQYHYDFMPEGIITRFRGTTGYQN